MCWFSYDSSLKDDEKVRYLITQSCAVSKSWKLNGQDHLQWLWNSTAGNLRMIEYTTTLEHPNNLVITQIQYQWCLNSFKCKVFLSGQFYALKRRVQVRIGDAMQVLSGDPMAHSATLPVAPGSAGLPCTYLGLWETYCRTRLQLIQTDCPEF